MGVFIKGMEMPKHGDVLVVREYNGKTYIKHEGHVGFEGRIIEVKEPHGRLKDVDRIEYENVYFEDVGESYEMVGKDDIDELPTVIEAEGETE